MRLFHTDFTLQGKVLTITEERVLKHVKVLRMKEWDDVWVQNTFDDVTIRYVCSISQIKNKLITCDVMSSSQQNKTDWPGMLIWLPNSNDKLHLIVQKLTEIWIQDIVFWKNDRSQWQDISVKKMSKLCKISLEALEQSNGWHMPDISKVTNIHERVVGKELVLFDFSWDTPSSIYGIPTDRLYGVVWPEGHFSPRDYETIGFQIVKKLTIWDAILRTETAAIVWWWILQNLT